MVGAAGAKIVEFQITLFYGKRHNIFENTRDLVKEKVF